MSSGGSNFSGSPVGCGCGAFMIILVIVLIFMLIIGIFVASVFTGSTEITKSTVARQPLQLAQSAKPNTIPMRWDGLITRLKWRKA